jgi:hypothetical protein
MTFPDDFEFEQDEWFCEIAFGIEEVRLMHQIMERFLKDWPGGDAREQEFAAFLKQRMFAMKTEFLIDQMD